MWKYAFSRYLLEKKLAKTKQEFYNCIVGLQMVSSQEDQSFSTMNNLKTRSISSSTINSTTSMTNTSTTDTNTNTNTTEDSFLYQSRHGESSSYFSRSRSTSQKSLLTNTTGTLSSDSILFKHLSLSPKQEIVFKSYYLLRSIAIDLRLYVCVYC